ncbi:MAG: LysR family transcriptional regulator [Lachnospiraceae bacterium]|nr:LysR family transcriptional regulator [Lachnospiraceae bacterium]
METIMSIKKYSTFLKIVELGSLSKAAEALGHTQSGITHILHSLEEDLGFSLMTRSRSGITLTHEGKLLLPLLQDVVNADKKLQREIKNLKHSDKNTIRIGTFTSVAVNWLPDIIKEFQSLHADCKFELIDGGYDDINDMLSSKKIDVGFVTIPNTLECKCIPLYDDRLLAVLSIENELAKSKDALPVKYFESEPVISLQEDTDLDTRTVLNASGITPNIKFRTKDDYAMLAMVEKNLGICIVPELLLHGTNHRVKVMELDPPAKRTIGIALPQYESASIMVNQFADFIVNWVNSKK